MKRIKKLTDKVKKELCGAQEYAEDYVYAKASGDSKWSQRYAEMAKDELKHAAWLHDMAVSEVEKLEGVYEAPEEMSKKWTEAHKEYVDKAAWIKQMLAM